MVPVTNGKLARRLKSILDACFRTTCRPVIFYLTALPSTSFGGQSQKAFRLQQYLTKEARRLRATK